MEEETMENQSNNNTMYYVLGAIVLVAVIAAGYLLRPKTTTQESPVVQQQAAAPIATPTLGPITRLACDYQFYNPVIGFPKYYLSVQGGDVTGATSVECTMTMSQANQVVATETVTSPLTAAPERNGSLFKCTTQGLELKPSVPTKVDVVLKDDQGAKATCSAVFSLPKS
jgi:hypothetical protein